MKTIHKCFKATWFSFFGSVEHLLKAYSNADNHQTLIIDMGSVEMVDLTGIYALEDLIAKDPSEKEYRGIYNPNRF